MIALEFEDDYGSWVSGFVFPAISEMNQFRDGSDSGYLEISIDNFNEEPVSKLQLATIEHFNKHQHAIIKGMYQGAFNQREALEDRYGFAREKGKDDSFPILNEPEDLCYGIALNALHILDDTKDNLHYIALTGDCNWDPEHGFGVIMHGERLIDFGAWDVSSGGTIEISKDNGTFTEDDIAYEQKHTDRTKDYQLKLAAGKCSFSVDDPQLNQRYSDLFSWLARHRVLSGYRYSNKNVPDEEKIKVLENLFSLDLSYRDIEALHPDLNLLQNLKNLWLNSIQLGAIPARICELKKLETFCADNCNLSELPAAFSQLTQLESFSLSSNNFTEFPIEIRLFTRLKRLRLDRNQIKNIPDWIVEYTDLDSLDLEENLIKKVPRNIVSLTKLQDFRIRNNRISERRKRKLNAQFSDMPRFYC